MSLIKANGDLTVLFNRPLAAVLALLDVALIIGLLYLRQRQARAKPHHGGLEE